MNRLGSLIDRAPLQVWRVTMPHGVAVLVLRHGKCKMASRALSYCLDKDAPTLRVQLGMLGYRLESVQRRKP